MPGKKYNHQEVEKKWQSKWESEGLYSPDLKGAKKKFYNLWMFPYPSGEGLHAGHAFASTGSDVYGRFKRMNGFSVFQPFGYDSFGMHSENFALKIGEHPKDMLARTTKNYERQVRSLGHGYDWKHTVTTSDVDYYKWTQWIFLKLFKAGLAYRQKANVNWCPNCKTVIADEQVIDEYCERCEAKVELKKLEQWFFRITDYADRLLENLEKIDWSGRVVTAQRNWIGRKEGINISYPIKGTKDKVVCFTTRPDTNFGATFIVAAPEYAKEHLLKHVGKDQKEEVSNYIKTALNKSEQQRKEEGREKTGVFTGLYATNQLNDYKMPIWISDFVLMTVGTGAVVGVPGHDKRDFEFAKKYNLEIIRVVDSGKDKSKITKIEQVQEEEGKMVNSEFLNGLDIHKATEKIMNHMEGKGWGERETNYHLRDWLISRQRYWGPPIPVFFCPKCAKAGESYFSKKGEKLLHKDQSDWDNKGWFPWDEEDLPIKLPMLKDYQPKGTGRGPLEDHPEFYEINCPHCHGKAKLETDVSDTFLDSAWYFLRYPSVGAKTASKLPFDPETTKKWLPVDLYFGGAEHSVLHLMYARFITMILFDLKEIDFEEPFPRFYAHGLVIKDGAKMSKSKGNVVSPDKYIEKYGSDTLRLYLMFMGPMDSMPDFRDAGIEGMRRFINRVWTVFESKAVDNDGGEVVTKLHQAIKKVTKDIQAFRYNTAISAIMELINLLQKEGAVSTSTKKILAQLLAPFAPHMAEEVWEKLGQKDSIYISSWPKYNEKHAREEKIEIAVQVNGKLRGQVIVDRSQSDEETVVVGLAKNDKNISKWLKGKNIQRTIFVPKKIINFVVKT